MQKLKVFLYDLMYRTSLIWPVTYSYNTVFELYRFSNVHFLCSCVAFPKTIRFHRDLSTAYNQFVETCITHLLVLYHLKFEEYFKSDHNSTMFIYLQFTMIFFRYVITAKGGRKAVESGVPSVVCLAVCPVCFALQSGCLFFCEPSFGLNTVMKNLSAFFAGVSVTLVCQTQLTF